MDTSTTTRIVDPLDLSHELQKLCAVAFDGVIFHENCRIISANPAALTLLGYSFDSICGQTITKIIPIPDHDLLSGKKMNVAIVSTDGTKSVAEIITKKIELNGRIIFATSLRDTTDSFTKSANLQRYRDLIERIVNNSFDVIIVYSKISDSVLFINDKIRDLLGHAPEDFLIEQGMLWRIIHEDDAAEIRNQIRLIVKADLKARVSKIRMLNTRHKLLWFESRLFTFESADGLDDEILIILRDIHETVDACEKLKESEELFRGVFENSSVGITLLTPDLLFSACNKTYCGMMGYSADELKSMKLMDVIHEDYLSQNNLFINQIRNKINDTYSVENEYLKKDKHRKWINAYFSVIRDAFGEISMFIGIATDIHDRKIYEGKLRVLSYAVEQSPFATILTDIQGSIQYVNHGFEISTGYLLNEIKGSSLTFLKSDENDPSIYGQMHSVLKEGKSWQGEIINKKKSGETYWSRARISPLYDAAGLHIHYMGILEDITEQKRVQEHLLTAIQIAESATKAKSDFLSNMSHEVRTPLNAIMGIVYLIEKTNIDSVQRDYLNKVKISSSVLLRMVNDILDISKVESGKLDFEKKSFTMDSVFESISFAAVDGPEKKNIECVFISDHTIPQLSGDRFRIEQVLMNLLSNAMKFTEEGLICVSAKLVKKDNETALVALEVSDTGIGIDSAHKEKIFESFSQADSSITRKFGGTGLGLAISKKIIELLGGSIAVESEPGRGSRFTISHDVDLPPAPLFSALFAVIWEDNEHAAMSLTEILSGLAVAYTLVNTSQEFIEAVSVRSGSIAFVTYSLLSTLDISDVTLISSRTDLIVTSRCLPDLTRVEGHYRQVLLKPFIRSNVVRIIDSATGMAMPAAVESAGATGVRLLLVDDDTLNLFVARKIFEREGFSVDIAHSGFEALDMLNSNTDPYDLIISDLHMPDLDGIETAGKIRKITGYAKTPLFILSADALNGNAANPNPDITGYIIKPIVPDELFRIVRKVKDSEN
jgi:PAS domain S-box-containing protein